MTFDTKILSSSQEDIVKAAELLKNGSVVAIPTETVYGLAANALDPAAVGEIFRAKGRPSDNPLIVHIAELSDIYKYVRDVPPNALKLAECFWAGPLTMVLPKKDIVPEITSGGLDTVGIRFPANKTARAIIKECGVPLAAPSANLSGSPSPTELSHVINDMNGRIPAIVDGGSCAVGVESTVVSFDGMGRVILLRPGFVTLEDIKAVVGEDNAVCSKGVTEKIPEGEKVLSPGMKYKHYAPKANVTILDGDLDKFTAHMKGCCGENICAVLSDSDKAKYPYEAISYGDSPEDQAKNLFSVLRALDERGIRQAYFRCPPENGVGLAVYNRLLRAAGFEVIRL